MQHRTCRGCGNLFEISPTERRKREWCSESCRARTHRGNTLRSLTCSQCGEDFQSARKNARHCSSACRRASRARKVYPDRTCPTCGNDFQPTTPNQRFCPPTEADRARQQGQATSKCAQRWNNARYRATTEQAECKHCTKAFDRTRGRSQHVYCSDRCHKLAKSLAKRIHPPKPRPHLHPIAAPRPGHDTLTDAEWADVLANDPCSYCYGTASGVDHIDPTSRNGTDTPDNWTASCHRCNGRKTSTPLLPFLNWDRTQREFQPWRELVAAHHRL